MTEPIRRSRSETHPPAAGTASDVLLIADEPRRAPKRPAGRRPAAEGRPESVEPLDMETVVRKLIAVLHEESES